MEFLKRFGYQILWFGVVGVFYRIIAFLGLLVMYPLGRYRWKRDRVSTGLYYPLKMVSKMEAWYNLSQTWEYVFFQQGFWEAWENLYRRLVRIKINKYIKEGKLLLEVHENVLRKGEEKYSRDTISNFKGCRPGCMLSEYIIDGKLYYEYLFLFQWTESKCVVFHMGWELGQLSSTSLKSYIFPVFSFKPYTEFKGINAI